jgi:hypothetical protein
VANFLFGMHDGRRRSPSLTSDAMRYSMAFQLWETPVVFRAVTATSTLAGQVVAVGRGSAPFAVGCSADEVGAGCWADAEPAFNIHKQHIHGPARRFRLGGLALDSSWLLAAKRHYRLLTADPDSTIRHRCFEATSSGQETKR